jgi:hypothetical protein
LGLGFSLGLEFLAQYYLFLGILSSNKNKNLLLIYLIFVLDFDVWDLEFTVINQTTLINFNNQLHISLIITHQK